MKGTPEERTSQLFLEVFGKYANVFETLTLRERKIIALYYGTEASLEEVGKEFGVTRERVRQILQRGINKLNSEVGIVVNAASKAHILEASVRTTNCLYRDLRTKGFLGTADEITIDLIVNTYKDWSELMLIRNLGQKSIAELTALVHEAGYQFAWELEQEEPKNVLNAIEPQHKLPALTDRECITIRKTPYSFANTFDVSLKRYFHGIPIATSQTLTTDMIMNPTALYGAFDDLFDDLTDEKCKEIIHKQIDE